MNRVLAKDIISRILNANRQSLSDFEIFNIYNKDKGYSNQEINNTLLKLKQKGYLSVFMGAIETTRYHTTDKASELLQNQFILILKSISIHPIIVVIFGSALTLLMEHWKKVWYFVQGFLH